MQADTPEAPDIRTPVPEGGNSETATPAPPIPTWALHRRLYAWTEHLAEKKHATWWLAVISFAESSFFPIPPDTLLLPLALHNRKRALWFAAVTSIASVLGGVAGYFIGMFFIDLALHIPGIDQGHINDLAGEFDKRGDLYVFVAALTPIPFKLLTITAGFAKMHLGIFIFACAIGRSLRFFLVAGLAATLGHKAKPLIEKHMGKLTLLLAIVAVLGIVAIKYLKH